MAWVVDWAGKERYSCGGPRVEMGVLRGPLSLGRGTWGVKKGWSELVTHAPDGSDARPSDLLAQEGDGCAGGAEAVHSGPSGFDRRGARFDGILRNWGWSVVVVIAFVVFAVVSHTYTHV